MSRKRSEKKREERIERRRQCKIGVAGQLAELGLPPKAEWMNVAGELLRQRFEEGRAETAKKEQRQEQTRLVRALD